MLATSLHSIEECAEKAGDDGFACVRTFLRSGLDEQVVTLNAPGRRDADDYECQRAPQQVRLVRHVAPNGKVRVLMTNLFDTALFRQRFPRPLPPALAH